VDCKAFTEHLEFYLDRELGEPERTEVQEHALSCTTCGAVMSKQREFRGRLRSSGHHASLPSAMAARLEASLMKQQPVGAAARPARNYRPYLLAAAALLLASAALRIALRDEPPYPRAAWPRGGFGTGWHRSEATAIRWLCSQPPGISATSP
jgi:anti-sigma factor RsiW